MGLITDKKSVWTRERVRLNEAMERCDSRTYCSRLCRFVLSLESLAARNDIVLWSEGTVVSYKPGGAQIRLGAQSGKCDPTHTRDSCFVFPSSLDIAATRGNIYSSAQARLRMSASATETRFQLD